MSTTNDDIVQFIQGQFNYTKNRWVGTGSKNLNDVNAVPPSRSQVISGETSSIASTGTRNTDVDLDLSAGSSSSTVPTASTKSWQDG
jgi:hypothetical protein